VPDDDLDAEDRRAIMLALMRIGEKLDQLLNELLGEDDDGEEEDLA
jgi:hypothetical protein